MQAQTKVESNLNVMSFNIRFDNPNDGVNSWQNRKEYALRMLRFNEVDVLGVQEALLNQLNDITKEFPEYSLVGVGSEDGKEKGEFSPILFNKNKFSLVKSGYFWLSTTPDSPSKGWDAACERIATWVQLKVKSTGKQVFIMNTHFDHIGQIAKQESVSLIQLKIDQLRDGLPVIFMGDLNSNPDSIVVQSLLQTERSTSLFDSRKIAIVVYGPKWTFHDFGRIPFEQRTTIDYILVSKEVKIDKYGVLAETLNETYLSDHTPVLIKISIE